MQQTVSERSAWIRRGWDDWKKGWHDRDVPREWREAYQLGRRRAKDDDKVTRAGRVEG